MTGPLVIGSGTGPGIRAALAVFLLALVLRLLFGLVVPQGVAHSNDAAAYRDIASNWVRHGVYGTVADPPHRLDVPYATRPPLVPALLALGGAYPVGEWLILSLVGALACAAIYFLAAAVLPGPTGPAGLHLTALAAALLGAVYPFFLLLSALPLTESANTLLYPLLALATVRAASGKLRDAAICGLWIGLSTLSKPVIATFLPLVILSMMAAKTTVPKQWLRSGLVVAVVAGMIVLPWTLRNALVLRAFVPVSIQFGSVLFQGSGPSAAYAVGRLEQGLTNGWDYAPDFGSTFPSGSDPLAVDQEAGRRAVSYISEDPGRFLSLAWRKEKLFWSAYSHPAHRFSWAAIAIAAVIGAWISRAGWRRQLPLYLLVAHTASVPIFFTSMPRFRAPIEPLLMVWAGLAVCLAIERLRGYVRSRSTPSD